MRPVKPGTYKRMVAQVAKEREWEAQHRSHILTEEESELEDRWRALAEQVKIQSFTFRDLQHRKSFPTMFKHWKERQEQIKGELDVLYLESKRYVVRAYNKKIREVSNEETE